MIQFQILSGQQAGNDIVVRRFPFTMGRDADVDLQTTDDGVWDHHLTIEFQRGEGFQFFAQQGALLLVNGERIETGLLRNGDQLELGLMRLRFWLARSEQQRLHWREAIIWAALIALFGLQTGIIILLLR